MKTSDAAQLLGIDDRTVRRFTERGLIGYSREGHALDVHDQDVYRLRDDIKYRQDLGDRVKEAFVMADSGIMLPVMSMEFHKPKEHLEGALRAYDFERDGYLHGFSLDEQTRLDTFLVEEVAARLKITDKHVVYDLLRDGDLRGYHAQRGGRERYFVSRRSFHDYMGPYDTEFFYNSAYASAITGKTVNEIDKLALQHGIGKKIKPGRKNSTYIFTCEDMTELQSAKRLD
jgi:hypothetical protein